MWIIAMILFSLYMLLFPHLFSLSHSFPPPPPPQPITPPSHTPLTSLPDPLPHIEVLPIGVITHRPALLERSFHYMLNCTGTINMQNVYVLEDGFTSETSEIIEKFGVNRVECLNQIPGKGGLNKNYRCLMDHFYSKTNFSAFIFLEEDLILAPDFYEYFLSLAPLLDLDPSVFCISAWNDNGYQMYASDSTVVIRQEHFGGLGWAISRRAYQQEIRNDDWPYVLSWDQYMQNYMGLRVCLAPEVSRTRHESGDTGSTINKDYQSQYFDSIRSILSSLNHSLASDTRLSDVPYANITVSELLSDNYDNNWVRLIESGILVACRGGLLDYENQTLIIYFTAESAYDTRWNQIALWFGLWGIGMGASQRGITRGLVSFRYATNRVLLLASHSPLIARIPHKFSNASAAVISEPEFGSHDCRKAPVYKPQMEVLIGKELEPCTTTCELRGLKCKLEYLPHVNSCQTLKLITNCTECVNILTAYLFLPALRLDREPACLFSAHENWLSCTATPDPNVRRVCTCINK